MTINNKNLLLYLNKWVATRSEYLPNLMYFQIHITDRCSNNCSHCYFHEINNPPIDIDLQSCCNFIERGKKLSESLNKNFKVDFIGGDPLLYPYIEELCEFCFQNKIAYGLKCNPNEIVNNWSRVKHIVMNSQDIMLSLDGLKETNDYIRGNGSFELTLKAITLLKDNNKIVRINYTASKDNFLEIIPLLKFFLNQNYIIDDFTWGRYWSRSSIKKILTETDLRNIFDQHITFLDNLFKNKNFYYFNEDHQFVPKIFYSFKEHLWIPYLIENNLLFSNVIERILNKKNCLNCTGTKDIYIIDQSFNIFNCRKIENTDNSISNFFNGNRYKLNFSDCICVNCIYHHVCKSCLAIPKNECIFFKRR